MILFFSFFFLFHLVGYVIVYIPGGTPPGPALNPLKCANEPRVSQILEGLRSKSQLPSPNDMDKFGSSFDDLRQIGRKPRHRLNILLYLYICIYLYINKMYGCAPPKTNGWILKMTGFPYRNLLFRWVYFQVPAVSGPNLKLGRTSPPIPLKLEWRWHLESPG